MQHLTAGGNAKMHNTHDAYVSDTIFHLHLWTVCQKSDFQNAAEAQKSEPKLSASRFPMDMT